MRGFAVQTLIIRGQSGVTQKHPGA